MFVRLKKNGARRYAYLVEGVSKNGKVRQRTLFYLGPIVRVAAGVPDEIRRKAESKIGTVDWNRVNSAIQEIPLMFEELEEMRRARFATAYSVRQNGFQNVGRGSMPRAGGELLALTILARNGFNNMFQQVGEREYRMR